jgi:hypothetical protein
MTFKDIKDIQNLIARLVADKIDAGHVVNMQWATKEILDTYCDIEGRDVDFYLITAKFYIADLVKRCIKKYDTPDQTESGQIIMDGFDHLQKAYPVERGEGREIVPVSLLTDKELELRAAAYDKMAEGCEAHAKEIRKYISTRAQAIAI